MVVGCWNCEGPYRSLSLTFFLQRESWGLERLCDLLMDTQPAQPGHGVRQRSELKPYEI